MLFSDLVILAKSGYKPSDVKELLEMCETDPKTKEADVSDKTGSQTKEADDSKTKEPELDAFEKLVNDNNK